MTRSAQPSCRPRRAIAPLLVAALLITALCWHSYRTARFNWDMLAYVGNALDRGQSARELHTAVYARAAAALPVAAYADLVGGSEPEYRQTLAADPDAFAQTRRLFGQRLLYIWAIRLLDRAGFEPFHASAALGAVSTLAVWLLMLWWLAPDVPGWWLPLGVPPFFFALQWADVARLSTPDTLACFPCLLAMYFLFEFRGHAATALALLMLAALARTEAIILGGLTVIGLAAWIRDDAIRVSWKAALAWLGLAAGLVVALNHFCPGYTWRSLISFCFFAHGPRPAAVAFSAVDYGALVLHQLRVIFHTPEFMLVSIGWALAATAAWGRPGLRAARQLLLLAGLNLVVRFALFPALEYRYYVFFVSVTMVMGLRVFLACLRPSTALPERAATLRAGPPTALEAHPS